jgi:endo-1,4-beta-D-glucanase Y
MFEAFDFEQAHAMYAETQVAYFLALSHAVWQHASIGQLSHIPQLLKEQVCHEFSRFSNQKRKFTIEFGLSDEEHISDPSVYFPFPFSYLTFISGETHHRIRGSVSFRVSPGGSASPTVPP